MVAWRSESPHAESPHAESPHAESPHAESPHDRDFAYLAMTIGTTIEVSDTDLQIMDIRGAALAPASFLTGREDRA